MSESSETMLDLEQAFLPAWAKQSPDVNRYAKFEGDREDRPRRFDDRGPRGRGPGRPGGDRPPGARRDRPPGGDRRDRPPGGGGGGARRDSRGPGGPQREGFRREGPRPEPAPLPEINCSLIPESHGVESLVRQIKLTGRAYPLFDIGFLILKKPDRYTAQFEVTKKADGSVAQPLYLCNLDSTIWLSEQEAVSHILSRHFDTFYKAERTATEPPKGTYTFVAQCGISGVILGPPNYHDYQNKLRKLHAERFARMPFDVFKSRVKIVRDEEVVKKWVEEQSWKTEFVALNQPEEVKLPNREEVEKHFKHVHAANIVSAVESHTIPGQAGQQIPCHPLRNLFRRTLDEQSRFPLKVVTVLSQQFAGHGLHFFKVNKTVTHVSVARPHFLDLSTTTVSDSIKRIIDFTNATDKCTRRKILDALAPTPVVPKVEAAPAAEGAPAAPATEPTPQPTADQTAIISDLHWLIHQGHIIEFANGIIETAKAPKPRPPKPQPKPAKPAAAATAPAAAPAEAPAAEAAPAVEEPGTGTATASESPAESAAPEAPAEAPVTEEKSPASESNPPA